MTHEQGDSTYLHAGPCDLCGSRDNRKFFSDGHSYCFSMGCPSPYLSGDGKPQETNNRKGKRVADLIAIEEIKGLTKRGIRQDTCQHFGYGYGRLDGQKVQLAPYYDENNQLVAQKVRFPDKEFTARGDIKDALPFGAHCWQRTGKKIVVTEGEIDCLSVSQAQGNKWPVVSIGCGAGNQITKYFAKRLDYFRGFDEVILMFDMDDPGRESAIRAASVLGYERAKIAELPGFKDANEALVAGKPEVIIDAVWKAKPYRPDGILDMASLKDEVMKPVLVGLPWVYPTLTALTYGRRRGELYTLGAGTGIGKTDFLMQQVAMDVTELGLSVGLFFLEQQPTETAKRLAGKLAGKTFHIPDSGWTDADLESTWESLNSTGKVYLYDSFGMTEWDAIREKMEFLAHAYGVKDFYLDNLTALVADAEDERRELVRIMAELGGLVKSLDCTITLVSHLATPDGKPHEEGGRVTIRHFKGAREIGMWSHYMIGLERDQQATDPKLRTTTTVRVLKDRYTGRATGEVFYLGYERETGRLYETEEPKAANAYGFTDETDDNGGDPF